MRLFPAVLLALVLAGCPKQLHPGAVNQYDSTSYDTVLVAHSVIETTKTDLANNVFPAAVVDNVKNALNDLIVVYNIADTAYITYHNAAVAGKATQDQMNVLNAAMSNMQTKSAALSSAKAAK
jgi:hypothetical protein